MNFTSAGRDRPLIVDIHSYPKHFDDSSITTQDEHLAQSQAGMPKLAEFKWNGYGCVEEIKMTSVGSLPKRQNVE